MQASRGTPQDLARASGRFGQDFSTFLEAGVEMAGQAPVRRGSGCNEGTIGNTGYLGLGLLLVPFAQCLTECKHLGKKILLETDMTG